MKPSQRSESRVRPSEKVLACGDVVSEGSWPRPIIVLGQAIWEEEIWLIPAVLKKTSLAEGSRLRCYTGKQLTQLDISPIIRPERMGYALAKAAAYRVRRLLSSLARLNLEPISYANTIEITTSAEMCEVLKHAPRQLHIQAAAVSDYTPVYTSMKIKKQDGNMVTGEPLISWLTKED